MSTHGNINPDCMNGWRGLGFCLALATATTVTVACGDDGNSPGNPGASAGTTSAASGASNGGSAAGQSAAGQSSTAGQTPGGQPSGGGPSSSAGQSPSGGQAAGGGGQSASGGNPPKGGSGGQGMAGGGTGGGSGGAGGGSGGTGGACSHTPLKGSDVCTIGDSWIQLPGNQVTTLENHMIAAGVLPSGSHFDRREVSGSTLSSIIKTYDDKPSNCKILVMDGGGIDLFTVPAGDEAAIAPVVQKFKDFLAKVKSDGYVQHIIYSLYPVIPNTKNLNVNMKPGFSAACAASAVDCDLVDLEPLFQGQHFAGDNTHADTAGGVIIGDAWWKAMQENCIAQ